MLGTVAQMERRFIKERQREGIERAKADGVHTGGKRRCTEIASKLFTRQETAQPVSLGTFAARECRSIEFLRSGLECHAQSSTRDAFSPLRRRFTLSQSGPSNLCDAGIVCGLPLRRATYKLMWPGEATWMGTLAIAVA